LKILNLGDVTYGLNHADMINKAIGTNYDAWFKSVVDLDQFGVQGVVAWFVFMDGSEHGYEEGWRWKNYIFDDKNEIHEYNVSTIKTTIIKKRNEDGYYPFRLCFQIDPYNTGNRYCCKFVGAFRLTSFLKEDLTAIKYTKVIDSFTLGSKGEKGFYLNSKDDFLKKNSSYFIPLEKLGFSDRVYQLLKRGNISYAGELLELGFCINGEIADEIRHKIFKCFGNT